MAPMGWSLIGVLCSATQGRWPCGIQSLDQESVPSNRMCHVLNGTLQMTQLHFLSTIYSKYNSNIYMQKIHVQ